MRDVDGVIVHRSGMLDWGSRPIGSSAARPACGTFVKASMTFQHCKFIPRWGAVPYTNL